MSSRQAGRDGGRPSGSGLRVPWQAARRGAEALLSEAWLGTQVTTTQMCRWPWDFLLQKPELLEMSLGNRTRLAVGGFSPWKGYRSHPAAPFSAARCSPFTSLQQVVDVGPVQVPAPRGLDPRNKDTFAAVLISRRNARAKVMASQVVLQVGENPEQGCWMRFGLGQRRRASPFALPEQGTGSRCLQGPHSGKQTGLQG